MQTRFELLSTEALMLTPGEREALVQLLSASLDAGPGIDDALAAEVERRIAEVENGMAQVIPMADALALVRAGLK